MSKNNNNRRMRRSPAIQSMHSESKQLEGCKRSYHEHPQRLIRDEIDHSTDSLMPKGYWQLMSTLWQINMMLITGAIFGALLGGGFGWTIGILFKDSLAAFYYAYNMEWIGGALGSILLALLPVFCRMKKLKISRQCCPSVTLMTTFEFCISMISGSIVGLFVGWGWAALLCYLFFSDIDYIIGIGAWLGAVIFGIGFPLIVCRDHCNRSKKTP